MVGSGGGLVVRWLDQLVDGCYIRWLEQVVRWLDQVVYGWYDGWVRWWTGGTIDHSGRSTVLGKSF